jgi:phosphatidylglycerophosphatase A
VSRPPPLLSIPARAVATAGGAGYSPLAPGTCGTVVAVPLAWLASGLPLWAFIGVTCAITVVGIGAAEVADRAWGTHDSGRIVIDEVAGYFVTLCFVDPTRWSHLLLGFVLFRLFDILKPPPVRWIDRNTPGGAGVVLDDVVAGLQAGLVLLAVAQTSLPARIDALLA